MKLKSYFTLIISFFFSCYVSAQIDVGTTAGSLEVSPTGALTYSVPIAIPPGVRDVAPGISLSYSSQSGNGIAGWGWNISGLSAITRIGTTLAHEGFINGVDFQLDDRFALDGQQLILTKGTYGKADSEYTTEQYSNIKVVAHGVNKNGLRCGPEYFEVFHPDGTIATYRNVIEGEVYNNEVAEWAMHRVEDAQGNRIEYAYYPTTENLLMRIKSIWYGGPSYKREGHPNAITFHYKHRQRKEVGYAPGKLRSRRANMLDRIEVRAQGQLYRKYQIKHKALTNGYELIDQIQESNKDGKVLKPIVFSYPTESSHNLSADRDVSQIDIKEDDDVKTITGDFDGDHHLDFLSYDKDDKKYLVNYLHKNGFGKGVRTNVNPFNQISTYISINENGEYPKKQNVLTLDVDPYGKYELRGYNSDNSGKYAQVYAKTFIDQKYINSSSGKKKDLFTGNFLGTGISSMFLIADDSKRVLFGDLSKEGDNISLEEVGYLEKYYDNDEGYIQVADYDGDGRDDLWHFRDDYIYIYGFNPLNKLKLLNHYRNKDRIGMNKQILLGDFNGDGKVDVLVPKTNSKRWMYLFSRGNVHDEPDGSLQAFKEQYIDFPDVYYRRHNGEDGVGWTSYYIAQDIDGDGKADLIRQTIERSKTRVGIYEDDDLSDALWQKVYLNTIHRTLEIFSNEGGDHPVMTQVGIVKDYIKYESGYKKKLTGAIITPDFNSGYSPIGYNKTLYKHGDEPQQMTTDTKIRGGLRGNLLFLDINLQNPNKEFVFYYGNRLYSYSLTKDHQKDVQLQKITNNLLTHDIEYSDFEEDSETYISHYGAKYPFVNINHSPGTTLVKRIIETGSGTTRKRDFKYEGAVSHMTGYGFIGFRYLKSTDWYGDNTPVIWNISKYDLTTKRGAVLQSWRSLSFDNNPSDATSRLDYAYVTKHNSGSGSHIIPISYDVLMTKQYTGQIFINKPIEIKTTDNLLGFTATETLEYDVFYNPKKIIVKNPTSTTTSTYRYSNGKNNLDHRYRIGMKLEEKVVKTNSRGSRTYQVNYQYYWGGSRNHLVKTKTEVSNNGPELIENLTYDGWGNLTSKTISASGVPDRSESFTYSDDGRFMTSKTDIEGQTVTYTYDPNSGNPISSKDHLGQTITTQYDGWGRAISETNYLGKETRFKYQYIHNKHLRSYVFGPDGSWSFKETNAFGQEIQVGQKNHEGIWVLENTKYDPSGRKTHKSEPRFGGASAQWTRFSYDQYGRLSTTMAFTGQIITTSYNGLRTTVDDGTKTVSTELDHDKNTISVTDPGGTIRYKYDAGGNLLETNYEGNKITITYDAWGRKTKLVDPSAGTYTYTYDNYGQLLTERSPKGETTYTYDAFGKVLSKVINGDLTDITENYTYDNQSKQITTISARSNGENYIYSYNYDRYYRPIEVTEVNNKATFKKALQYDGQGRVANKVFESIVAGSSSTVNQQSIYGQYGHLVELRSNSKSIWKLEEQDARGNIVKATLGNNITQNNTYDAYGFYIKIKDVKDNGKDNPIVAIHNDYNFDAKTGRLLNRTNHLFDTWEEKFSYDNLNRLTKISGDVNHTMRYDPMGRITENSSVGAYSYPSATSFQLAGIDLNTKGNANYTSRPLHQMTFNAFKKPMTVNQQGHGKITYTYNPGLGRSHAYYGNEEENFEDRKYHKHYSSIFPGEVVENREQGTTKFITYLGGDAYSAVAAQIKITKGQNIEYNSINYLHRDYLGSIMAITDANSKIREQIHYGAWGTVDQYWSLAGNDKFDYEAILQRGYTGHEHFFDVGLIHMNGRIYDANLGRFLSPDNYVQDPGNTQNFNRYGYAYNNPLMYTDPSGEIIGLIIQAAAAIISAAIAGNIAAIFVVGAVSSVILNGVSNLMNGQPFFAGSGSAFLFGGISAVMAFGIGQNLSGLWSHIAHGFMNGVMAEFQGGEFGTGFGTGFVSHSIAVGAGELTKKASNAWRAAIKVASGTLAGGITSKMSGGSWIMGIRQGFASSLFNAAQEDVMRSNAMSIAEERLDEFYRNKRLGSNASGVDDSYINLTTDAEAVPSGASNFGIGEREVGTFSREGWDLPGGNPYASTKRSKNWIQRIFGATPLARAVRAINVSSNVVNGKRYFDTWKLFEERRSYVVGANSEMPRLISVPTGRYYLRPGESLVVPLTDYVTAPFK